MSDSELSYFQKHYRENLDYDSYEKKLGRGCIFNSSAGSGKTTKLCEMVKDAKNPLILSITNKAIENVKSRLIAKGYDDANNLCHTFDSYFCEWNGRDINSLKNKTLFIEEFLNGTK